MPKGKERDERGVWNFPDGPQDVIMKAKIEAAIQGQSVKGFQTPPPVIPLVGSIFWPGTYGGAGEDAPFRPPVGPVLPWPLPGPGPPGAAFPVPPTGPFPLPGPVPLGGACPMPGWPPGAGEPAPCTM